MLVAELVIQVGAEGAVGVSQDHVVIVGEYGLSPLKFSALYLKV
jgi:hypothetical protein